jgi:hypothetical protein
MQARDVTGLRAHGAVVSGNLAKAFCRQVRMLDGDRSIDEPDFHFRAAAGAIHQRGELH